MKEQYRVGLIGFAHFHIVEHVQYFSKDSVKDRFVWIGGAPVRPLDCNPSEAVYSRKNNAVRCRELGALPVWYDDYHDLLDQKPDLIMLGCENYLHADVICDIVSRGIDVLADKPLTDKVSDVEKIAKACASGGGRLITNYPSNWKAAVYFAKQLVKDGKIGKIHRFHFHNQESLFQFPLDSNGARNPLMDEWWFKKEMGGGSLSDYCSYGCSMALEFLEKRPQKVVASVLNVAHQEFNIEDYSAVTLEFDDAIAILEGTWATKSSASPTGPILWGSDGSIEVSYFHRGTSSVKVYKDQFKDGPCEEYILDSQVLPENRRFIEEEVLHFLDTGDPLCDALDIQENADIASILEAAHKSVETGCKEEIHYFNLR